MLALQMCVSVLGEWKQFLGEVVPRQGFVLRHLRLKYWKLYLYASYYLVS